MGLSFHSTGKMIIAKNVGMTSIALVGALPQIVRWQSWMAAKPLHGWRVFMEIWSAKCVANVRLKAAPLNNHAWKQRRRAKITMGNKKIPASRGRAANAEPVGRTTKTDAPRRRAPG
jgi:hypothetical protein